MSRPASARALAGAAAAALVPLAAAWVCLMLRKTAPDYWDEGIYYAAACRLRAAAGALDVARVWELLASGDPRRPPLLALAAAPFLALDGGSIRAAFLVNALGALALGACVVKLARAAQGGVAAALALWACFTAPLLFGLSRLLLVEFSMAVAAACSLALMIGASRADAPLPAVRLGLLLGAGCLLKPVFPIYIAAPLVWTLRRRPARLRETAIVFAAAAAVAGPWYLVNAETAARWAWSAGFGEVASDFRMGLAAQAARIASDLGWWHAAAAVALGVAALRERPRLEPAKREARALLALAVLSPLPVFLLGVNKETRYLAPLLPPAAVLLGAAGARALARGGLALPLALGWLAVSGAGWLGQAFALDGFAPAGYNRPPDARAAWNHQLVLERLRLRARGAVVRVAVASVSESFHPASYAALAVRRGAPVRFTALGYPQGEGFTEARAVERLKELDAGCVLFLDGAPATDYPPFFNRATPALRARLEAGREPWRLLERVALAPGLRAAVFGRRPDCS